MTGSGCGTGNRCDLGLTERWRDVRRRWCETRDAMRPLPSSPSPGLASSIGGVGDMTPADGKGRRPGRGGGEKIGAGAENW